MYSPNIFDLRIIRDSSHLTKLLLILLITFSSLLIIGFLFILLSVPLFHINMTDLNKLLEGELGQNIGLIKYYQASQSVALFIVPSIILNYLIFTKSQHLIQNSKLPSFFFIIVALLLTIFMIPLIDEFMHLNEMVRFPEILENKFQDLEKEAGKITDKLLSGSSFSDLLINTLVIAIIPAIGEEFYFRGIWQQFFIRWLKNGHLGVIFGAILFSSIHLQFYGFIPRMMLGILFGYVFYWSNNIWLPVLGHFLNNFITVVIQHFKIGNILQQYCFTTSNLFDRYILLIVSVILSILMIVLLRKICLKRTIVKHL